MNGTTWSLIHADNNRFYFGWFIYCGVFSLGSGLVSLIEQLGGYEKAKAEFEALKKHPELYSGEFAKNDALLLEHRRAHNIYEVGDKVIVITNALGNKFTWEVSDLDGCMVEISQIGQPNEWVHYAEIAHAIPEEIQAGRRLEVCGG